MSDPVYGVYHDYESDYRGDYTFSIASASQSTPNRLQVLGAFVVYEVDAANPSGVLETWQQIWSDSINRSYDHDFELYYPDGRVEIFIGVQS